MSQQLFFVVNHFKTRTSKFGKWWFRFYRQVKKCKDDPEVKKGLPICPAGADKKTQTEMASDVLNNYYKNKLKNAMVTGKLDVSKHCENKRIDITKNNKICKPGGGTHYNCYCKEWKSISKNKNKADFWVGSVTCCKCCYDTKTGPKKGHKKCNGAKKHQESKITGPC